MDRRLKTALSFYGLDTDTKLLRNYDNLVYQVKAEQVYALKIYSPTINYQRLISTVEWLSALRRDTDLLVPKPVPNNRGNLISQIEDRYCVLFEWLNGEPVSRSMSSEVARKIGEIIAKLHLHAVNYRPNNYTGDRFDYNYFFGSASWWQAEAKERLQNNYESLIPAIEKAKGLISSMEESPEQFGMIHSDLHFSNVISNKEQYAVIDFGECGMGYYLMDIAVTESEFEDYKSADELIAAFRAGYRDYRSFPNYDVETFKVISSLLLLEWIFESESDRVRQDKIRWVPEIVETMTKAI